MEISGKAALVTGGGSGIGRATALLLAQHGAARIALLDLNETGLAETKAEVEAAGATVSTHRCDVSDAAALTAAFDAFAADGPIDIVFNNAGIVSGARPFPDAEPADVARILNINVAAVMNGTTLAFKHMAGRGGVVINTGSTSHNNAGFRDIMYSTSKAAVVQFSRASGQFHATTGVRVCCVNPTLVDTPIIDTTGGDKCADWMEPVLANNRALPPVAIAEGVLSLIVDEEAIGKVIDVTLDSWSGEGSFLPLPADRWAKETAA